MNEDVSEHFKSQVFQSPQVDLRDDAPKHRNTKRDWEKHHSTYHPVHTAQRRVGKTKLRVRARVHRSETAGKWTKE